MHRGTILSSITSLKLPVVPFPYHSVSQIICFSAPQHRGSHATSVEFAFSLELHSIGLSTDECSFATTASLSSPSSILDLDSTSETMGRHYRRRRLIEQRSNLLVLSAIVSASNAIVPPVSADDSLPSQGKASLQLEPVALTSETRSQFPPSKSKSRLLTWAYDPPPAGLDRNLQYDRFAQHLGIRHKPPPAYLPAERPTEIIDDDDEDDQPGPQNTDPNYQPVPTRWLMRGYSRVAGIPASLPTDTMTRGYRQRDGAKSPAATPSDLFDNDMISPCTVAQGSQMDWMLSPHAQILGSLTLFFLIVMMMESVRYVWRACGRRSSIVDERGRLALHGDEKQLRAFAEDMGSKPEAVSARLRPPV